MTAARPEVGLLRSAVTISAWNTVSRVTGFVRVLAVGAALGATFVGNTYQSSNLVSNLMFELLAAGLLSAPLVPAFVALIDRDDREGAVGLANALLGVALVALGAVVALAVAGAPWIMRLLTLAVHDSELRHQEIRLGTFFLWFFLPQVLLYACMAVATALLNSDRRFASGAIAPVANNLVVTATMIAYVLVRSGDGPAMDLPTSHRVLLAAGTTAGVLAMAAIPIFNARHRGLRIRPRWQPGDPRLRAIAKVGLWGGVLLAAVQVLIGVTLVLANQVRGGVVAYQIAFTFFLLPVALIAHPVYTAIYPRLAAAAQSERWSDFAADVAEGVRRIVFFVLPGTAALVVLGGPAIRVLRLGAMDVAGARLIGRVLAAYALGLAGYGCFLLLARAWTAAGDARRPAIVAIAVAGSGTALMILGASTADGTDRVVALGLAHSVAMTAGAIALFVMLTRHAGQTMRVSATVLRSTVGAVVTGLAGWTTVQALDGGGRRGALAALAGAGVVMAVVTAVGQWLLGAPELREAIRGLRGSAP
jgi:putative peptidoglycan lipid II flippase